MNQSLRVLVPEQGLFEPGIEARFTIELQSMLASCVQTGSSSKRPFPEFPFSSLPSPEVFVEFNDAGIATALTSRPSSLAEMRVRIEDPRIYLLMTDEQILDRIHRGDFLLLGSKDRGRPLLMIEPHLAQDGDVVLRRPETVRAFELAAEITRDSNDIPIAAVTLCVATRIGR